MLERKEMLSERLSEPPTEIPQENQPVQVLLFCLSPKQSGRTECILNSQFFIKEHSFCSGYFLKLFCMPSCFLDAILIVFRHILKFLQSLFGCLVSGLTRSSQFCITPLSKKLKFKKQENSVKSNLCCFGRGSESGKK